MRHLKIHLVLKIFSKQSGSKCFLNSAIFSQKFKKIYIRGEVILIEILNHYGQPCIILTQDYVLAVYFSLLRIQNLKKNPTTHYARRLS